MGRPEQTAALIAEGLTPGEIAHRWSISTASVIQYAYVAIGEGRIKRSDLFFVLAKKYENAEELFFAKDWPVYSLGKLHSKLRACVAGKMLSETCETDELAVYLSYRTERVYVGDMYVHLAELERGLHKQIKSVLVKKFGTLETCWWRKGVPQEVRAKCAVACEESDDEQPGHPYDYTTLIHLNVIFEKRTDLFASHLPVEAAKNQNALRSELKKLNGIRNRVMHPVRSEPPTLEDFEFVREMHKKLHESRWR